MVTVKSDMLHAEGTTLL